ncbi:MAG: hypothetical protein EXQ88_07580 [Alphaproteobacteria bacterium]|nr:hypothetical protein [Alphaproteobacteria bacterium]
MAMPMADSSLLLGANAAFVAELYARYAAAPDSVDASWREFFARLGDEERSLLSELSGASWAPRSARVIQNGHEHGAEPLTAAAVESAPPPAACKRRSKNPSLKRPGSPVAPE